MGDPKAPRLKKMVVRQSDGQETKRSRYIVKVC